MGGHIPTRAERDLDLRPSPSMGQHADFHGFLDFDNTSQLSLLYPFACSLLASMDGWKPQAHNFHQAQPAMTVPQYVKALMNVDLSDQDSLGKFINLTQIFDWRPHPEPVVLGTEKGYKYQLISSLSWWEISSDITEDAEASGAVVEIRSALANTISPVQYIVPLGFLQCVTTHITVTVVAHSNPFNTIFPAY